MVIWINGAYGVGKSTLAEALLERIPDSSLFDAEAVGNAVRDNYPDLPYGVIFEDYPLWCEFCCALISDIHTRSGKTLIVPMTLLRERSRINIIEKLRSNGIDVHLIVLEASRSTVHDRILSRGEDDDCWCIQNIGISSEGSAAFDGLHLKTDGVPVSELIQQVLNYIRV